MNARHIFITPWAKMETMLVVSVDIHPRLCFLYFLFGQMLGPEFLCIFALSCWVMLSPPADGLLLISDARLPECPVGLLQTEGDSPLQVIFIVSSQVNHICIKEKYTHTVIYIAWTPILCSWFILAQLIFSTSSCTYWQSNVFFLLSSLWGV